MHLRARGAGVRERALPPQASGARQQGIHLHLTPTAKTTFNGNDGGSGGDFRRKAAAPDGQTSLGGALEEGGGCRDGGGLGGGEAGAGGEEANSTRRPANPSR